MLHITDFAGTGRRTAQHTASPVCNVHLPVRIQCLIWCAFLALNHAFPLILDLCHHQEEAVAVAQ